VTEHPANSEKPDSNGNPETTGALAADPPALERDDHNDYAAHWQARSGFFNPPAEPDRNRCGPGQE
jgi:hypothetical protein